MTPEQVVINTILNGGPPGRAPYHIEYSESRPYSGQSRCSLQVPNVLSDSASSCSFGIKSDNEESEISRPASSQGDSLLEFEQEITAQTEVTFDVGHSPRTTVQEIYPIDPISATYAAEAQSQSIATAEATSNLKTMELTPSKRGQVHRDKRETWQTCRNEKKLLRIFPINDISKDNSDVTVWDYNNDGTSNTSVHFFGVEAYAYVSQARIGNFLFQRMYKSHLGLLIQEHSNFLPEIQHKRLFLKLPTF